MKQKILVASAQTFQPNSNKVHNSFQRYACQIQKKSYRSMSQ